MRENQRESRVVRALISAPRMRGTMVVLGALATAASATAMAQTPSEGAMARTIAVGVRGSGRFGEYSLGGFGGQVRLRIVPRVSVELFTEHHLGHAEGVHRHDHEVGGALLVDAVRGRRWAIQPLLGACAMLAMADTQSGETLDDLRFGARAGVGAEWAVGEHLSLQAQAVAIAYFGRRFDPWQWPAGTSGEIRVEPVGQLVLGVSWFL